MREQLKSELQDLEALQEFLYKIKDALCEGEVAMATLIVGALGQHLHQLICLKKKGLSFYGCENQKDTKENGGTC